MNTLRALCRTCIMLRNSARLSDASQAPARGLTRRTHKSDSGSDQVPTKSGKQFYKNVITRKRDEQYKQIAELESISKSLSTQRRNPALKLKRAPLTANARNTDEGAARNRKKSDGERPILDMDHAPLATFPPDLIARAQHLFTKAPLLRLVAESVEEVRAAVFVRHGTRLPEIAIVGRSNVGKSSLLNALLARNKALTGPRVVSNVSSTPGCTRALHFLQLDHRCVIVDLPGYGYAAVGQDTRRSMTDLISAYWHSRIAPERRSLTLHLKRVIMLIDSRVGVSASDEEVMRYLSENYVPWLLVLTKVDKLAQTEVQQVRQRTAETIRTAAWRRMCYPEVLLTSTHSQLGIEQLRALVLESCEN